MHEAIIVALIVPRIRRASNPSQGWAKICLMTFQSGAAVAVIMPQHFGVLGGVDSACCPHYPAHHHHSVIGPPPRGALPHARTWSHGDFRTGGKFLCYRAMVASRGQGGNQAHTGIMMEHTLLYILSAVAGVVLHDARRQRPSRSSRV